MVSVSTFPPKIRHIETKQVSTSIVSYYSAGTVQYRVLVDTRSDDPNRTNYARIELAMNDQPETSNSFSPIWPVLTVEGMTQEQIAELLVEIAEPILKQVVSR